MGEDDHAGMAVAEVLDIGGREPLMHFARTFPGDDLDVVIFAVLRARYWSGIMSTRLTPSDSDDCVALDEVQQISDSAFTAAEVLT